MSWIKLFVIVIAVGKNLADDWILESNTMRDPQEYPVLSNGHVGFTVFDDTIYMNGLYNGKMEESHRARIENHASLQAELCDTHLKDAKPDCLYRLKMKDGLFEVVYSSPNMKLTHIVFPHRYYTRTIVNKFTLERLDAKGNISVPVHSYPGNIGLDLTFPDYKEITKGNLKFTCEHGSTLTRENGDIQSALQTVSMCSSELKQLFLSENQRKQDFYAYQVVDQDDTVVLNEIEKILNDNQIVEKHVREWQDFWNSFDIQIEAKLDLTTLARSSIFYLVSNLPSKHSYQTPRKFYGVSSSGLGRVDSQTKGRITWDQEMFMQTPLLLMNPEWSEALLDYRYRIHAEDKFSDGWNYFWETGFTGEHLDVFREMTRSTHVPADVAFAVRQHLSATEDIDWFRKEGCDMAFNTAKYWAKRTSYNVTSDLFDLFGMGTKSKLDDPLPNNAFVNVAVAMNLYLGDFASCICGFPASQFKEIARSLTLPLDEKEALVKVHSDYETYIRTIGADVLLTIYPLQYELPAKVKNNTLAFYRNTHYRDMPPTTWALHLIADLEAGGASSNVAYSLFYHLESSYIEKPFQVWTDKANRGVGTVYNFVAGAAAFLQVLMNGYAGVRLHFDRMEIKKPHVTPDTQCLKIKGLTYLGAKFEIEVHEANTTVVMLEKSPKKDVILMGQIENKILPLDVGQEWVFKPFETLIIYNKNRDVYGKCKLAKTVMGIPKSDISLKPLRERARANGPRVLLGCVFVAFAAILAAFLFILYRRHGTVLPSTAMRYVRSA